MDMFEGPAVKADLESRLKAAGLDPSDPNVSAITSVVSRYFAERTAEVLAKVNAVLSQISPGELH